MGRLITSTWTRRLGIKRKKLYPEEKKALMNKTEEMCLIIDDLLSENKYWKAPAWLLDSMIQAQHSIAILNSDAEKLPVEREESTPPSK